MNITITIDKSKWEARYKRMLSRRAYARREATIVAGKAIVRHAYVNAPWDTGRFKKNLAEAANAAGLGPLKVVKTTYSKYTKLYTERLRQRVEEMRRQEAEYREKFGPRGAVYNRLLKRLGTAEQNLHFFQTHEDAIVIGAGKLYRSGFWGENKATARWKTYTGRGRIRQTRDQTIIEIHNTEAHASIVEARSKVMRNAINAVRSSGGSVMKLSKKRYLEALGEKPNS